MKNEYAHALLAIIASGTPVDTALAGLRTALKKKHHDKLLSPILQEALRVLSAQKSSNQAVVMVASAKQAAAMTDKIRQALSGLGASTDTSVEEVVDETLIGGFVATYNYQEHDQSYKRALKSLFESITA